MQNEIFSLQKQAKICYLLTQEFLQTSSHIPYDPPKSLKYSQVLNIV